MMNLILALGLSIGAQASSLESLLSVVHGKALKSKFLGAEVMKAQIECHSEERKVRCFYAESVKRQGRRLVSGGSLVGNHTEARILMDQMKQTAGVKCQTQVRSQMTRPGEIRTEKCTVMAYCSDEGCTAKPGADKPKYQAAPPAPSRNAEGN